jgi:hypothetical protein
MAPPDESNTRRDKMTRKDYRALALCIGYELGYVDAHVSPEAHQAAERAIHGVAQRIAIEAQVENPRFDRAKFDAAIVQARKNYAAH